MNSHAQNKLHQFLQDFPLQERPAGSMLISAGEAITHMYVIESGYVRMSTLHADGTELSLHFLGPHSLVSLFHLYQSVATYDFISLTPVKLRVVPPEKLKEFLLTDSYVLFDITQRLMNGIAGLLTRIEQLAFLTTEQRLASVLLFFATHFGQTHEQTGVITLENKFTHFEISRWLGVSRENVSIQMKTLERRGWILQHRGHIQLINVDALKTLAGQNEQLLENTL